MTSCIVLFTSDKSGIDKIQSALLLLLIPRPVVSPSVVLMLRINACYIGNIDQYVLSHGIFLQIEQLLLHSVPLDILFGFKIYQGRLCI